MSKRQNNPEGTFSIYEPRWTHGEVVNVSGVTSKHLHNWIQREIVIPEEEVVRSNRRFYSALDAVAIATRGLKKGFFRCFVIGDGNGSFFEHQIVPIRSSPSHQLFLGWMEEDLLARFQEFRRQPFRFDAGGESNSGIGRLVIHIDAEKQLCDSDDRFGCQLNTSSADHQGVRFSRLSAFGETVGIGGQQGLQ